MLPITALTQRQLDPCAMDCQASAGPGEITPREQTMSKTLRRYAIAAVVFLARSTAIQAQGLPDVPAGTVLPEVMMDAQGSEAQLYGSMFGSSPSPQTLDGTSMTDPSTGTFSFSLLPGSTYLGEPITDNITGGFNSTTDSYAWRSMGSFGGQGWEVFGEIKPVQINANKWELLSYERVYTLLTVPPKYVYQAADRITIFGGADGKPAFSIKSSQFRNPGGAGLGLSFGRDVYNPLTGTYRFVDDFTPGPTSGLQPLAFQESTTGITPFAGGSGTYTTTIQSVPEPCSLLMALIGMGITLGVARRWRAPGGRLATMSGAAKRTAH